MGSSTFVPNASSGGLQIPPNTPESVEHKVEKACELPILLGHMRHEPCAPKSSRPHESLSADDRLSHPIDHSAHWSQLMKPKKKDLVAQAEAQLATVAKTQNEILDRLQKCDAESKLQYASLMSSVANKVRDGMGDSTKIPLRTVKSLKRDEALARLARIMAGSSEQAEEEEEDEEVEQEEPEEGPRKQAESEEEQEEEEDADEWKTINFESSPARKRERKEGYTVFTQKRKESQPRAPRRERRGKRPLDLIGVLEVVPNTPSRRPSSAQETSVEWITVHASDFIKHGKDVKVLRTLRLDPPPLAEPDNEPRHDEASKKTEDANDVVETHFVPSNCWAGLHVYEGCSQDDSGINQVWFPPSPRVPPSPPSIDSKKESVYDRLFRQGRRGSRSGIARQIPNERASGRRGSDPGPRSGSWMPLQVRDGLSKDTQSSSQSSLPLHRPSTAPEPRSVQGPYPRSASAITTLRKVMRKVKQSS
jgi:hypothetical protein